MTRKLRNTNMDNNKPAKRILKPVVEKKRRDRINQSLGDLRTLLLKYTSDVRLQNPKIEKAEILDLTVEYLQKRTEGHSASNGSPNDPSGQLKVQFVPVISRPHSSDSTTPLLFSIHNAGFQQCMAQLAGYMHKVTPSQRMDFMQELKNYMESHCPNAANSGQANSSFAEDFLLRINEAEVTKALDTTQANEAFCNAKEDAPKLTLLPHFSSPPAGHSFPMPCPEYLSPPPSPFLACSPPYTSPPPFPTIPCHFSFPPSLSPLSSNTSFSYSHPLPRPTMPAPVSFSPVLPLANSATLHFASPASRRSPVSTASDRPPANSSSCVWRPW